MDNVQKNNNCINIPSSQIFRSYSYINIFTDVQIHKDTN
jgi:hypothetical protein